VTANPIDALFRLGLTLVVLYFWSDNVLRAYRLWHAKRTTETYRSFIVGVLIEVGMFTFLAAAIAVIVPEFRAVAVLFSLMTTGALLVVGAWSWVLWRPRLVGRIKRPRKRDEDE
jgi:hypothetical protein